MTHHNGKPHSITRRRETAKVRRERLEAEAREKLREQFAHLDTSMDDWQNTIDKMIAWTGAHK